MKTVEEYDVKIHFSSILIDIERDRETVLICRNGKPIADLRPHEERPTVLDEDSEHALSEKARFLQKAQPLVAAGVIVLPTKPKPKASMPTITVSGTPLSQIIIEDRR